MAFRNKLLLLLGLAAVYYFNPLYIRSSTFSFARAIHGFVDLTPAEDPDSLKAAVANATSDMHELTSILEDFFQRQPDDSAEASFKEFLRRKATSTKHKNLEYYLDWVLGFYKFAWPFILVYALMKISAAGKAGDTSDRPASRRSKLEEEKRLAKQKALKAPADAGGLNSVVRDTGRIEMRRRVGSAQSLH